ncbi:MAG: ATP-dependent DNA helicase RecQ [Chloroflexi bacterium]|nr:ATP-dependent DNA helicase RecQ [Chloroflexota bacterium]
MDDGERIRRTARERFGYGELRPGQEEAIGAVLAGRDTLVVMPTGSGKSAIYQIAGLMLSGPTVIISPLIALQRDQVEALEGRGVGEAAVVNSTLGRGAREEALEGLEEETLRFLFLAPEQFNNEETLERLGRAAPALFVVDEAHCISEWGHDFRPEYLRLGAVAEALSHPTVLALTATASPPVRQEIMERLAMRDPKAIVQGFDRPNIWLGVEKFQDERSKSRALLERVVEASKPGIVYVATRRHAEEIAASLRERGVVADPYHAGMAAGDRERAQEAFMRDEVEVIVATIAFGMGVDKPNVRFVFHYDISDSVDSYYQEIGRAGRDGDRARAILFYRPEDLGIHRFFAGAGQVDEDEIERVALAIQGQDGPVNPKDLAEETALSESKVMTALSRLEEVGAVDTQPTGEVVEQPAGADVAVAAEEAARAQERHRQYERSQIEMMRGYAEVWDCRREYLLNYFGQEYDEPCGFCDNCEAGIIVQEDETRQPFPLNGRVVHTVWGEGLVERYEGDAMIVLFDDVGYKKLAVDVVVETGALQAAT